MSLFAPSLGQLLSSLVETVVERALTTITDSLTTLAAPMPKLEKSHEGVSSLKTGHSDPAQPALGRFLVRDPIRYEGGTNLYAYCGNNPINCVDPFGLIPPGEDVVLPDRSSPLKFDTVHSPGTELGFFSHVFSARVVTPFPTSEHNRVNLTIGTWVSVPPLKTVGFSAGPIPGDEYGGWDVEMDKEGPMFFYYAKTEPGTFVLSDREKAMVYTTLVIPDAPDKFNIDATFSLYGRSATSTVPAYQIINIRGTLMRNSKTGIYEMVKRK